MSVMPIWMVERNLSGSSMIRSARRAPAFPCRARSSRLERRAEISAISDMAKMPLSRISRMMMTISILNVCGMFRTSAVVRMRGRVHAPASVRRPSGAEAYHFAKIRKVERRSKRMFDSAETEYLRRSQSTKSRAQKQTHVRFCRDGVSKAQPKYEKSSAEASVSLILPGRSI